MATKNERKIIRSLSMNAEMAVTRFSDEWQVNPDAFWADKRTAHSELADGWSWALAALDDVIKLLERVPGEEQLVEAMRERMAEFNEQCTAMYSFKTEV